ncbi:MAG: rane protein [Acidobacteriales bacterium]|nr:rane protein [Terriglobales bacterium]
MLLLFIFFKFSMRWLWHLGGLGLILLALVDNSLIPTPGGMDIFTVILAANRRDLWWYYGIMATVGSMIGGYLAYRVGRKGGKDGLEKRFGAERLEKVYKKFEQAGFFAVFVPAILPPPFPTAPFLVAAGALDYPLNKYMAALGVARAIRYMGLAYVAFRSGRWIIQSMHTYYRPLLWTFTGLLVTGGIVGGSFLYVQHRRGKLHLGKPGSGKTAKPSPKHQTEKVA